MINQEVIALDSGLWQMKIGFAGDEAPRYLERSVVGFSQNYAITASEDNRENFVGEQALQRQSFLNIFECIDDEYNCHMKKLEILWHDLFYEKMRVDITDFSMIISLSSFFDEQWRTDITSKIFETFNVPAIYTINSNICGILAEGKTTGIILDSGYSGSYAVNIFEGYPIQDHSVLSQQGGKFINDQLKIYVDEILKEKQKQNQNQDYFGLYGYQLNKEYFDDLKIQAIETQNDIEVKLPDETNIIVNKETFDDIQNQQIQHFTVTLKNVFEKTDEILLKEMKRNIYFQGGNTLFPDIEQKVMDQLINEGIKDLKIYQRTKDEKKYSGWIGASLFASLSTFNDIKVTKQWYEENGSDSIMIRNLI